MQPCFVIEISGRFGYVKVKFFKFYTINEVDKYLLNGIAGIVELKELCNNKFKRYETKKLRFKIEV